MAQTNRKRRRKHRGTQAGTVESRGRTSRPAAGSGRSRTQAKQPQTARERREARLDREPTWRGALNQSLIAAGLLAVFWAITNKNPLSGIIVGVIVLVVYVPMTYTINRAVWRRRQKKKLGGG